MRSILQPLRISISVFICILFYDHFFLNVKDNLVLVSTVSAVYATKSSTHDMLTFVKYRFIGTILGCLFGSIYSLLNYHIKFTSLVNLAIIPLFIFIVLLICGGDKNTIMTRAAIMPMLALILLTPPTGDATYISYRIIATFIGLAISVIVTYASNKLVDT